MARRRLAEAAVRRLALGGFEHGIARRLLPVLGLDSPALRYELGLVTRANYAYGVRVATTLASRLGHPGVTVIELGVSGGNGLLRLEEHARYYSGVHDLEVTVVGFDLGTGLPQPRDHRDLPYIWRGGFFEMDEPALRARLRQARLVIGDVRETIPRFVEELRACPDRHPVGFVSFDLDYFSSTADALTLFAETEVVMPRVTCYFDDVIGKLDELGPMRAIRDFNEDYDDRTIGRLFGQRSLVPFQPQWADRLFEAHFFDHPSYQTLVHDGDMQQPLR